MQTCNNRIFFWLGGTAGLTPYGIRRFERYEEDPVILVLHANPSAEPLSCRYPSGSPGLSNGKKSPGGPTILSGK